MPRLNKNLLFLVLFALFGLAASRIHSFDIFWQLQSGRYMLQTRSFIYTDIFSLAPQVARHEHCWLHDLVCYGVWLLGGYSLLSLLKGLLIAGTAAVLVAVARVRQSSWWAILLLVPAAVLLTRGGWLARPQLWTFLGFALFLLVLERFRRFGDRWVLVLPLLMLAWANLHAGAILAFPVLLAYLVGEGVPRLSKKSTLPAGAYRRLLLAGLLVAAASLVTPYPSKLIGTLLGQLHLVAPQSSGEVVGNMGNWFNMDWRPTSFYAEPYFYYALGLATLLLVLGWRRLNLTDFLLLCGLGYMGLKLGRHTPFFLFAGAALLPSYLDAAVAPLLRRVVGWPRWLKPWPGLVALLLFGWLAMPALRTYGFFDLGLRHWQYPVAAAKFVKEQQLKPQLYNTYDWGGYLMWTLYPSYRVFWDGRSDSPEMFRLGWNVTAGQPDWSAILQRFAVNTVVSKACTVDTGQHYPLLDRLAASPDWSLVFADVSALVFVRSDSMSGDWLQAHRLPASRIDDTVLSEARLLVADNPGRYMAWWEIARIEIGRRNYATAFHALEKHLSWAPPGKRVPAAERYFRMLYPMLHQG